MKNYIVKAKRVAVCIALPLVLIVQFVMMKKYEVQFPVMIFYLTAGLIFGVIASRAFSTQGIPAK